MHIYVDANVGSGGDDKSTTGINVMLAGAAIIVISNRQHVATPGPHVSETIAATEAVMRAIVTRGVLHEFLVPQVDPTPILSDSETTRLIIHDARSMGRSAWMANRVEFVGENQTRGEIDVQHIPGTQNPADSDTKFVDYPQWARDTEYKLNTKFCYKPAVFEEPIEATTKEKKK